MSKVRTIEQKLITISPGDYQRLCDEYLKLKLRSSKIVTLGTRDGSSKTTKGTPDSYFDIGEGKYIFAQYGSNEQNPINKIEEDIKKCIDYAEEHDLIENIDKIICANASSNIHPHQYSELMKKYSSYNLEILTTNEMAHNIVYKYPHLAEEYLDIKIGSGQIVPLDSFITENDKKAMSASLSTIFTHREDERTELSLKIANYSVTIVKGPSGVGKTRLVVEELKKINDKIIKCIRENGNSLFDDLPYLFEEDKEYILFIDDINGTSTMNLKNLINFIVQNNLNQRVKIVATVRDYAYLNIIELISEFTKDISTLEIEKFNDDELKELISTNYPTFSQLFVNQIYKISRGNPRLAILISHIGKESSFDEKTNIYDVFSVYYKQIINNSELSIEEEKTIFIVALLGKHSYKNSNKFLNHMLSILNLDKADYVVNCLSINRYELVHIYRDEIVELPDQNLRDYLLYYGLIEKRYVSISNLLLNFFPEYKKEIVNNLNIITGIFKDVAANDYIVEEVNTAWDSLDNTNLKEFLKTFGTLNSTKTFSIINAEINSTETELKYDLNIVKTQNISVTDDTLMILSPFLNGDYLDKSHGEMNQEIAINLVLNYLEKRPILLEQVYEVLSSRNSISDYNHISDYKTSNLIIDKIIQKCEEKKSDYYIKLFLMLSEDNLKLVFENTELSEKKAFVFKKIPVIDNQGQRDLRGKIYLYLGELYKRDFYEDILDIIAKEKTIGIFEGAESYYADLIKFELNLIDKYISNEWTNPDFLQCTVLEHLNYIKQKYNIEIDISFCKFQDNENFMFYQQFIGRTTKYKEKFDYEKMITRQEQFVDNLGNNLTDETFTIVTETYQLVTKYCKNDIYMYEQGITSLIEKLNFQDSLLLYNKLVSIEYLNSNILDTIANKLVGHSEINELIPNLDFKKDSLLLFKYYLNLTNKKIDQEKANTLMLLIENNNNLNTSIKELYEYKDFRDQIQRILEIYLKRAHKNNNFVQFYLYYRNKGDFSKLKDIFAENYDILSSLYLLINNHYFDSKLVIFNEIVASLGANFIIELFNKKDIQDFTIYSEFIWQKENYKDYIDLLFENYYSNSLLLSLHSENIFCNSENTLVKKNQKNWIKSYIDTYSKDGNRVNAIFKCINDNFSDTDRVDLITYFITKNPDIDIFKRLWLFNNNLPAQSSFANFDRINKKFYAYLLDNIDKSRYLEHVIYLKNLIDALDNNINKIEIKEYLEDF